MKIAQGQKIQNAYPIFEEIFAQVSPEISKTFTQEQIAAIRKSFQRREWHHQHSLDVRISAPIPLLRFYLVILAGEERRSKQRLQHEKSLYPLWNFGNIVFFIIFSCMILTGSISTFFLFIPLIPNRQTQSIFPTSIPWIKNQHDCERSNRIWMDNKCWDHEHSHTF